MQLAGAYCAPAWLPGGHAQTIWPTFLRKAPVRLRRETVDTGDGDIWNFDWLDAPADLDAPLVVLFHGLEGGSDSHYARALFTMLAQRRWRGVVPHFRGCPETPNRLPRAYHSGDHDEIAAMLAAIRRRSDAVTLHACGVSLGASALLNWLGRAGSDAANIVAGAAAVSAPLDLMAAGLAIDRGMNRVYARHFLSTLKPKALEMAARFPGLLDTDRVQRATSMWQFDDVVTAKLAGFSGTDDYWTRGSSKPWLHSIAIPTLVLNARNDPFVPASSLPLADEVAPSVTLEQPDAGGHAGFPTGAPPGRVDWLPRRLIAFFAGAVT
ncbi:MAG TPA: alpha/beta fold hydrolase [Casimicrobiaceae bacterium]|nr:alpha/beta fold hydrolase [Casimicrobiaceae bacterium]